MRLFRDGSAVVAGPSRFPGAVAPMLCRVQGGVGIHADLFVGQHPTEGYWKVRLTIFSGPDYRTPVIERRAAFGDEAQARGVAAQAIQALEQLAIPITRGLPEGHWSVAPLLGGSLEGTGVVVPRLRAV